MSDVFSDVFEEQIDCRVVHVVRGACFGWAIVKPYEDSDHLSFVLIVEDDGDWMVPSHYGGHGHTCWLPDVLKTLDQAIQWCEDHAAPIDENLRGYRLKE